MKKLFLISCLLFMSFTGIFSAESFYFYIQLADKNHTPYSLSHPEEYLSERAIARREAFHVKSDSTDLPVNPAYINQLAATGVKVHCKSKWLNGVTVLVRDSSIMKQVRALPFVKWAKYTGKIASFAASRIKKNTESVVNNIYGSAYQQINQLNGTYLHEQGYTGKGIVVGVLDAGFTNVDVNPGLDSLRLQGRLLGIKDIITPGGNVYDKDEHGANVLTIMTGNLPEKYLGTAPHASFWLIRTEYSQTEYVVETDFWVAGLEFADSVGVDIINSSLGYTEFDDPAMNYTYADMNGKVSRASIAAGMAAGKGIIVCNSAGNEGNKSWHYIGAPADADNILGVGAVTATNVAANFTSFGPASDGRVKPDVSAMGYKTAYINTLGTTSVGNGTSYASPVMTGMMACFLQYLKNKNADLSIEQILHSVRRSASLYTNPDTQRGYGTPDFESLSRLMVATSSVNVNVQDVFITYNNVNRSVEIKLNNNHGVNNDVLVYSITGIQIVRTEFSSETYSLSLPDIKKGIYIVTVDNGSRKTSRKLIIP
jgi:hypothetical protein